MIVPSYYQNLAAAQNLQFIIDQSQDFLSNTTIWRNFLTLGPPQWSLKFETIIGRDRISAAASIVDSDSPAPLRSRNKLERYSGNIPTMKEKFVLKQEDMREIEMLRQLPVVSGGGDTALISFLIRDVQEATVAGEKRIDILTLQAISTLTMDMGATGNPDGVSFGTVDLLPQSFQKQGVPTVWSNAGAATPIDDIQKFIEINQNLRGRQFKSILFSTDLWYAFRATTQVKNYLASFFNTGKGNTQFVVTLETVNEFFAAQGWPPISTINYTAMIEVDGLPTYIKPFDVNACVFLPAGPAGILANAIPMERIHPVTGKTYAASGPTLISKWCDDDPLREFTGMEMLAIPALAIDGIFILTTNVVAANFV